MTTNILTMMMMGIPFSAILYPINNHIVGSYNRRMSRKLLGGKS